MKKSAFHSIGACASGALMALPLVGCSPGPLPAESPPTELSQPLAPMPVQVESTAPATAPADTGGLTSQAAPVSPTVQRIQNAGFRTPEAVLYDPDRDVYWVSNIGGAPTALDNNGFISQVNPDGSVKNLQFIAGGKQGATLNAPKGMGLHNGMLWVTDLNAVRRFDANTGRPRGAILLPKATFLNDIAIAKDGSVYVSDSGLKADNGNLVPNGSDAIYRIEGDRVSVFARGPQLEQPNGLLSLDDQLLSVTFGSNKVLVLSSTGEVTASVELPAGGLDGIEQVPDGRLMVSSWAAQAVFVGTISEGFTPFATDLASPADIGVDRKRGVLLVPLFTQDELAFVPLVAGQTPVAGSPAAASAVSGSAAPSTAPSTTAVSTSP